MEKNNFINSILNNIKEKNIDELTNIIINNKKIKYILNKPLEENGNFLLHYLAEDDCFLDIIKILFDKYGNRININIQNCSGNTPLHISAINESEKITKFLVLQKNADVNIKNYNNCTAFFYSIKEGDYIIKDFYESDILITISLILLKNNYNFDLLYKIESKYFLDPNRYCKIAEIAVKENCVDVLIKKLTVLLENNNNLLLKILDKPIKDGKKLIHLVAEYGQLDSLKSLINVYKNINTKDDRGFTPLQLAMLNGHNNVVNFLLEQDNINNINIIESSNCLEFSFKPNYKVWNKGNTGYEIKELVKNYINNTNNDENDNLKDDLETDKDLKITVNLKENEKSFYSNPKNYKIIVEEIINNYNIKAARKLFLAYKDNKNELLKLLNEEVINSETLFQLAVRYNIFEIVKILINEYEYKNINIENNFGFTPLQIAISKGYTEIVDFLLKQKNLDKNIDVSINDNSVVFSIKPNQNIYNSIKKCINNRRNINITDEEKKYYSDPSKYCAIAEEIIINNNIEVLEKLFEVYRDNYDELISLLDKLVKDNKNLFQLAAEYGRLDIIKILINKTSKYNLAVLELATINGHTDIVNFLIEKKDIFIKIINKNPNLFHFAAEYNRLDILKMLINKYGNCELNSRDYFGRTPLLLAVKNGHINVVKFLLEQKNIDLDIKDYNNLQYIIEGKNKDIINILIDYVVKNGNNSMLKFLLSIPSISIDINKKRGKTLLDIAIKNNNIEAADLLIRKSNDSRTFKEGEIFNSIFITIKNKTPNLLKFITNYKDKKNCNINKGLGEDGITPLHYAVANKDYKSAKILLKNGADVNAKTNISNFNSINFAIFNKDYKMVQLLFNNIKKQVKNQVSNFNKLEKRLKKQQDRIKNITIKLNNTRYNWLIEKRRMKLLKESNILYFLEKEERIQAENIKKRIELNNFNKEDINYLEKNKISKSLLKKLYEIGKNIDKQLLQSNKIIFNNL